MQSRRRIAAAALVLAGCSGKIGDQLAGLTPSGTGDLAQEGQPVASEDGAAPTLRGALPCEIDQILERRCRYCHQDPVRFGAPMPLTSWAATQRPAVGVDAARIVWEEMQTRVANETMPPTATPTGALTEEEKSALLSWLDGGAPATDGACSPVDGAAASDAAVDAGETVSSALPCSNPTELRTYGATPDAPYEIPQVDDDHPCFVFPSPFKAGAQAIAWAPIVDDARVIHHWVLKTSHSTTKPTDCTNASADQIIVWTPGNTKYEMPPDVGLELPDPGYWLTMDVHYNNKARFKDARDRSGVAICTVDQPRKYEAGIFVVGAEGFAIKPNAVDFPVRGRCPSTTTSRFPEPLRLFATMPHMHQTGVSFQTQISRGGTILPVADVKKFSFDGQTMYPLDPSKIAILPGDEVQTTCSYTNPSNRTVVMGGSTTDEMCFNFLFAYPIGSVRQISLQCIE